MPERTIPLSELREHLSSVVGELATHGKAVQLTHRGTPVAVLMGFDAFEALLDDLDDADDYRVLAEYDASVAAGTADTIPWELAARDLGVA